MRHAFLQREPRALRSGSEGTAAPVTREVIPKTGGALNSQRLSVVLAGTKLPVTTLISQFTSETNHMKHSQIRLVQSLTSLGFTADEIAQLRRIERTLHRWSEAECGDSNDYCSWSIERAEPIKVTIGIPSDSNGHVWIFEDGARTVDLGCEISIDSSEAVRALKRKQARRDREIGKPFRVVHPHSGGKPRREAIADRESGALKRLARIVAARNKRNPALSLEGIHSYDVISYHQTDPRGCALYLLRASDIRPGESIESVYSRGVAVAD